MAGNDNARSMGGNSLRHDSRRPLSEFLPYLPYHPHLVRSLAEIHERTENGSSAEAEASRADTLSPETNGLSRSKKRDDNSRSASACNSYVVNPPLCEERRADASSRHLKILPLPPSLMVNGYRHPTMLRHDLDTITPLGSASNPVELVGTPPWEWLPELPGSIPIS